MVLLTFSFCFHVLLTFSFCFHLFLLTLSFCLHLGNTVFSHPRQGDKVQGCSWRGWRPLLQRELFGQTGAWRQGWRGRRGGQGLFPGQRFCPPSSLQKRKNSTCHALSEYVWLYGPVKHRRGIILQYSNSKLTSQEEEQQEERICLF